MKNKIHPEGPELSRFVSGMWRLRSWGLTTNDLSDYINKCIEHGVTTFDHADIYGCYSCQDIFGEVLKQKLVKRENIELVSKCGIMLKCEKTPDQKLGFYDTSKKHIIQSAENSLQSLGTDYLDLLLIHRPDPIMDPSEIADAFSTLKNDGKVKYFGVSNFTTSQINMLQSYLNFPLVTNQIEYSVVYTHPIYNGVLDQALEKRMSPMIWSPLAGGRIFNPQDERDWRVFNELNIIKEETGADTADQVALAWILKHPSKPLIVLGSGKIERIVSQLKASEIELTREQWFRILKASHGHDVP